METRSKEQIDLENIANLIKTNKYNELKTKLEQQETRFTGSYGWWNYHKKDFLIENAVREAILSGHENILKLLLDAGLDPNDRDENSTPLIHFAAKSGKLSMVKLLVEYGAKIYLLPFDHEDIWHFNNGLDAAIEAGFEDIVDYLLECGAEVNGYCANKNLDDGITFLAKAADKGNIHIVESLIKHEADIPFTLYTAYKKMYAGEYVRYVDAVKYGYSHLKKLSKLEYAFNVFSSHSASFYENYSLTQEAKIFFNELLTYIEKINPNNNDEDKDKFLELFTERLFKQFKIKIQDKEKLKHNLNKLLDDLEKFNNEKRELQQKAFEVKNSYTRIVKTCMDYAMGCDFPAKEKAHLSEKELDGLTFLGDLEISGINFSGVSIAGKPVNEALLRAETKSDTTHALITMTDIAALQGDDLRRNTLIHRMQEMQAKRGVLVTEDGVVNLVPMNVAAEIGDIHAVKSRIEAGEDPNAEENASSLNIAAKRGHEVIVKMLMSAHAAHTTHKPARLFSEAKSFLAEHKDQKSLFLTNGKIAPLHLSDIGDDYQIIFTDHEKFTSTLQMMKQGGSALRDAIESVALYSALDGYNLIMLVKHGGRSMEYVRYKDSMDRDELKKMIADRVKLASLEYKYLPVVITNPNNLDVIEAIIKEQYQKFDKSKALVVKAIETARKEKHPNIAEFLESSQNVNQADEKGKTLLHKAVEAGDLSRVQELIAKGADANAEDMWGKTPLVMATEPFSGGKKFPGLFPLFLEGKNKIVETLLEHKADPNKYGYSSPLSLAAEAGNANAVAMLLSITDKEEIVKKNSSLTHRKDLWYVDMMYNALDKENGIAILKLLKQFGADFNEKSIYKDTLLSELIKNINNEMLYMRGKDYLKVCKSESYKSLQADIEKLNYLLANGANLCAEDKAYFVNPKDFSPLEKEAENIRSCLLRGFGHDENSVPKKVKHETDSPATILATHLGLHRMSSSQQNSVDHDASLVATPRKST